MLENLAYVLTIGAVIFVIYLSNFSKKKEFKEKQKHDEFKKRLEDLSKSFDDKVRINEEVFNENIDSSLDDSTLVVEKFQAKRINKK